MRNDETVKNVEFIVRNGDQIKNIAARIKVPARDIVKLNKLHSRNYLAYPGQRLIIPVPVQPKVWDPTKEDLTGNTPSTEDRKGSVDFELVIDSTNYRLAEDFISMSDAIADSVEYANIESHMNRLEKRINYLYYKIDSFKKADFKFEYDDAEKNTILVKMKDARDKFYSDGPMGKQIDSMKEEKKKLGYRRIVLRGQASEYEYLSENASYSEHNFKKDGKEKPANWGDHLNYQSAYEKNKPKPVYRLPGLIPVFSNVDKDNYVDRPLTLQIDTLPAKPAFTQTYIEPNRAVSSPQAATPPVKNETPQPAKVTVQKEPLLTEPENVNLLDNASEEEVPFTHFKTDFALLKKQKFTTEIAIGYIARPLLTMFAVAAISFAPVGADAASSGRTQATSLSENINDTEPANSFTGNEYNRDHYLTPADSVTRIKGEFYHIRARQAMDKGDFTNGDKFLRKSLAINPNNAEVWILHADLLLSFGSSDQALKEYMISSEINPNNPKVFYNIALLYNKSKNTEKAYDYFSRAIIASDKYVLAFMGRASLSMDKKDYDAAIQDYDQALVINKYFTPAMQARGIAKMEVRKFADAISDFDHYLALEKPDGYVFFQRGLSKVYSNDLLQGCLDLSKAQELGFKDAEKAIKKFCQ